MLYCVKLYVKHIIQSIVAESSGGLHIEYAHLEPRSPGCQWTCAMRGQMSWSDARPRQYQIKREHGTLCKCQAAGTAQTTTAREEVNTTTKDTSPQKLTVTQLVAKIKKLQHSFIGLCVCVCVCEHKVWRLTQIVYEQNGIRFILWYRRPIETDKYLNEKHHSSN